jgi:hypothetical protein
VAIRTELEELVKWISELSAKPEPDPTQSLPRADWLAVEQVLGRASGRFREARLELVQQPGGQVLSELACDLEREAQGLAFRAHLLSRRAPPPPKAKPKHRRRDAGDTGATDAPAAARVNGDEKAKGEQPPPPPSAGELVALAQRSLETAHTYLAAPEHPDPDSQAFEGDLDVLAEMALSLRQQSVRLLDQPKADPEEPPDG